MADQSLLRSWNGARSLRVVALVVVVAVAILGEGAAAFGHEDQLPGSVEDLNARSLNILEYHPYPDAKGDPFGFPYSERNGTRVGYMEATYNAFWFPTVVVDGVHTAEGATQFLDAYNTYETYYKDRAQDDAPFRLSLGGILIGRDGHLEVDVLAKPGVTPPNATLRVTLYEDEVPFDGGNGVKVHRFTARAILHDAPLRFAPNGTANATASFAAPEAWNLERLGVVAAIVTGDASNPDHEAGQVVQAATYRFGQSGPTMQYTKGVLMEAWTAAWCAACVFGDGAVNELADAYGLPSSKVLNQQWAYYRGVDEASLAASGALGAAAAVAVALMTWRRRRP